MAQDEKRMELEKCVRLEGGFIRGGNLSSDIHKYDPGVSFQYSYCLKVSDRAALGLGGGILFLDEQGFTPFYLDFIVGPKKKKSSPFINLQAGYAFSWDNESKRNTDYSSNGPSFGIAIGHKFKPNNRFAPYLSLGYRHQILLDNSSEDFIDATVNGFNYSMVLLNIGVMLQQY